MVKKVKIHGTLPRQPADLHSLETALFRAREIAEELGEVVLLYFIDMAITEAKMESPPTANDHKPQTRNKSRISRKKTGIPLESGAPSSSSSALAHSSAI
jgi:hypothetical protein